MNKGILAAGVVIAMALANGTAFAAGDAAVGEKIAKAKCTACHDLNKGGPIKVGPPLFGVFGRTTGTFAGYSYSPGYVTMGQKGHAWDDAALKSYLMDPKGYVQAKSGDPKANSKMIFRLEKDEDAANVIAYLHTLK